MKTKRPMNEGTIEDLPPYDAIFNGMIKQQKGISNILMKNMKIGETPPGTSNLFAVEPLTMLLVCTDDLYYKREADWVGHKIRYHP